MKVAFAKNVALSPDGANYKGSRRTLPRQLVRARIYAIMAIADAMIISASLCAANCFRFGDIAAMPGVVLLGVVVPFYLVTSFVQKSYRWVLSDDWREGAEKAINALALAAVATLFVNFSFRDYASSSREVWLVGIALSAALLVLSRRAFFAWVKPRLAVPLQSEVVIWDGMGELRYRPSNGVRLIDTSVSGLEPNVGDPEMLSRLSKLLRGVDRVIVSCAPDQRRAWASILKSFGMGGELLMPEIVEFDAIGVSSFAGNSTLVVTAAPLSLADRCIKRTLDIVISSAAIVFFAPALIATAVAIKLDSRGPVLFVQPRLGENNQLFNIYKFRTMRSDQCDDLGSQSTLRRDQRVTRIGRFLRKTSFDELPQIFNVLHGEMSIVGPRPHALGSLAGDKLFWEIDQRYWQRHVAKPGMTGLAQIKGFRGSTEFESDLSNRLRADLEYVRGWSIWRDLAIIVATVKVLLHSNAY